MELFESVAENFLQNALEKRKIEAGLRVKVSLRWEEGFVLSVCDDGQPVPEAIAAKFFVSAVPSNSGLGVGMFQAARFARQEGFEVALTSNQPGRVCFTLSPAR
jgi:sensor histidine kinase regulating citrate/malate metabolism